MSRTVVVSGVSSFIGCHLARRFAADGSRVIALCSRTPDAYSGIRAERIAAATTAGAEIEQLDLTVADDVTSAVQRWQPDLWLQHAGYAENYGSLDYDLASGFRVNVEALHPLFRALAGSSAGVLVTGSSAEYADGDAADLETDAVRPATPYGLAKLAQSYRTEQLAERYGVSARVARVYIPFGPFDAPQKLLASVVEQLRADSAIDLSPCLQARDFIHVEELVEGYVALAGDLDRECRFDLFNLCSGRATPLKELLLEIASAMQADPALLRFGGRAMRAGEADVSFGSCDKAQRLLGWKAGPLKQSVRRFLDRA